MEINVNNVDFDFLFKWFCDGCRKVISERSVDGIFNSSYQEGMYDAIDVIRVIFVAYPEFLRLNAGEHKRKEENVNAQNQTTLEKSKQEELSRRDEAARD